MCRIVSFFIICFFSIGSYAYKQKAQEAKIFNLTFSLNPVLDVTNCVKSPKHYTYWSVLGFSGKGVSCEIPLDKTVKAKLNLWAGEIDRFEVDGKYYVIKYGIDRVLLDVKNRTGQRLDMHSLRSEFISFLKKQRNSKVNLSYVLGDFNRSHPRLLNYSEMGEAVVVENNVASSIFNLEACRANWKSIETTFGMKAECKIQVLPKLPMKTIRKMPDKLYTKRNFKIEERNYTLGVLLFDNELIVSVKSKAQDVLKSDFKLFAAEMESFFNQLDSAKFIFNSKILISSKASIDSKYQVRLGKAKVIHQQASFSDYSSLKNCDNSFTSELAKNDRGRYIARGECQVGTDTGKKSSGTYLVELFRDKRDYYDSESDFSVNYVGNRGMYFDLFRYWNDSEYSYSDYQSDLRAKFKAMEKEIFSYYYLEL